MRPLSARAVRYLLLSAVVLAGPSADAGCEDCHGNPDLFVQKRNLHTYYQDWLKSPHAAAGLGCADCHGGDPEAAEMAEAHGDAQNLTDPNSPLYYKTQPQTCGACHADKLAQFRTSKHYRALIADTIAPTCTTCHRAMNKRPYYREILVYSCRTCHNEQNAERIPLVADRAGEVLHRLNIAKGYLGWTQFYYESRGWPDESEETVKAISQKYERAVTNVHSFDLDQMDHSSIEILSDLKAMYQQARDEQKEEKEPPQAELPQPEGP